MTTPSVVHAQGAVDAAAASGVFSLTWLLVGLPLLGAAVLLLGGRRTDRVGHLVGTVTSWAAFVVAAILFFALRGRPAEGRAIDQHLFSWVPAGSFRLNAGLLLDPL